MTDTTTTTVARAMRRARDLTPGDTVVAAQDLRVLGHSRTIAARTTGTVEAVTEDHLGPCVAVRWAGERQPIEYRGAGLLLLDAAAEIETCTVCGAWVAIDGSDDHTHDMDEAIVIEGDSVARTHGYERFT